MDVLMFLKKDHADTSALIDQLQSADEGQSNSEWRIRVFDNIKSALTIHTTMEERILYPILQNFDETRDQIEESLEEHHKVDQILEKLSTLDPIDEEWAKQIEMLKKNVQHHVEEEENELFPKAEKLISREQRDQMGQRMLLIKNNQSSSAISGQS